VPVARAMRGRTEMLDWSAPAARARAPRRSSCVTKHPVRRHNRRCMT